MYFNINENEQKEINNFRPKTTTTINYILGKKFDTIFMS